MTTLCCILPDLGTTVRQFGEIEVDPNNWRVHTNLFVHSQQEGTAQMIVAAAIHNGLVSKAGALADVIEIAVPLDGECSASDALEALEVFFEQLPHAIRSYLAATRAA